MLKANVKNLFLLTRPYSLITIMTIALLANVIVRGNLVFDFLTLRDITIGLLTWFGAVYFLEFLHRHIDDRKRIPTIVLGLILGILILILFVDLYALLVLGLIFISVLIYSTKSKDWALSGFVFLFRSGVEIGIILIILILHKLSIASIETAYPLIIIIFLTTTSRNLVGDLRDTDRDKYTFPKKFGKTTAYVISLLLLLASFFFVPSLVLILFFIPILILLARRSDGYFAHKVYVLCSLSFFIGYLIILIDATLVPYILIFIGVLLIQTYDLVPRKARKDLTTIEEAV